jgi:hypothetical protein
MKRCSLSMVILLMIYPMLAAATQYHEISSFNTHNDISATTAPFFIENRGQIVNESVRYYMTAPGKNIYLTDTGVVIDLYRNIIDRDTENYSWQTESLPYVQPHEKVVGIQTQKI